MVGDNMGPKRIAVDFGQVDFARAAEGFGARGMRVDSRSGLDDALVEAHKKGGPVVIDLKVDPGPAACRLHTPTSYNRRRPGGARWRIKKRCEICLMSNAWL